MKAVLSTTLIILYSHIEQNNRCYKMVHHDKVVDKIQKIFQKTVI